MKLLYISNRSNFDIGSVTHLQALKEIVGEKNFFRVNFRVEESPCRSANYVSYGKYRNKFDRIIRWSECNNMYISNYIINDICEIVKKNDIEVIFSEESFFGNLFQKLKSEFPNIPIICFFHDIGADLHRQWRKENKNFINFVENTIDIFQERKSVKYADINIVFHKDDANRLNHYYGIQPDYYIPLCTYPNKNLPVLEQEKKCVEKKLLFVGSSYYPNIKGIRWFYKNVLPFLNENIELKIVGMGTEILREEFTDSRVKILGKVESLEQYYLDADIVILPIFDGGGMKVKTIEAVSYAKCIIGTKNSLAGFWDEMDQKIKDKIVFSSESDKEWIEILNVLLKTEIYKFNSDLYALFLNKFSYDRMKNLLDNMLSETLVEKRITGD